MEQCKHLIVITRDNLTGVESDFFARAAANSFRFTAEGGGEKIGFEIRDGDIVVCKLKVVTEVVSDGETSPYGDRKLLSIFSRYSFSRLEVVE